MPLEAVPSCGGGASAAAAAAAAAVGAGAGTGANASLFLLLVACCVGAAMVGMYWRRPGRGPRWSGCWCGEYGWVYGMCSRLARSRSSPRRPPRPSGVQLNRLLLSGGVHSPRRASCPLFLFISLNLCYEDTRADYRETARVCREWARRGGSERVIMGSCAVKCEGCVPGNGLCVWCSC